MRHPLWDPSPERIKNSNMTRFMEFVGRRCNRQFTGYFDLYDWSVANIADFWAGVWDFLDIKASKKYEKVVDDLNKFPGARWFAGRRAQFCREPAQVQGQGDGLRLQVRNKAVGEHHIRGALQTVLAWPAPCGRKG